jgi:hypothetical protein
MRATTSRSDLTRSAPPRRALATALFVVLLALAICLVAPGNARAEGELSSAPAGGDIPVGDQQASSGQTAISAAEAAQQHPSNLVVSIRINSPGDDGPISQENAAVSVANGSNGASTTQDGTSGAGQDAATDQSAGSEATTSQDQPGNVVISIRINSPGNGGSIDQSNVAASVSIAGNTSVIAQGGSPDPAAGPGIGAQPDTRPATGPPAQGQTQPPAPSATTGGVSPSSASSSAPVARAAIPAPRKARPTGGLRHPDAARNASPPNTHRSTARAHPARSLAAAPAARPEAPVSERGTAPVARPQAKPAAVTTGVTHTGELRQKLGAGAASLFHSLAPRAPQPAGQSSGDASSAVLLTLVALACAFLVFLGSKFMPSSMPRLSVPRIPWR